MKKRKIDGTLEKIKQQLGVAKDTEMCDKMGWKYGTLDTWKARDKIPKARLYEVANKTGVPVEYFLENENDVSVVQEPGFGYLASKTIPVPVLSATASAGGGNNVESIDVYESSETLSVDRKLFGSVKLDKIRAIEVDGHSMVPVLLPGSIVFFEEGTSWEGDGLYVLVFRGVLMVKIVEANPENGNLRIKSANPDYESWEYDPTQDQSTFRIVGRVRRVMI